MSCGQLALHKAGIEYDTYYASEIDKHAIKVTQHNYPNTKQLGSVENWKDWELPKTDLLIGGSPCTGFSASGKGLNFNDPRSRLFFEYVNVLRETKPKYFLLENVKMKKEWMDRITKRLEVEPIEINSSLVSAHNRVRLYWTNIPNVTMPKDKGINLIDILEDKSMTNPAAIRGRGKPVVQCLEVKSKGTNKSNCLTTVAKDNVLTSLPSGKYIDVYKNDFEYRYYTMKEYCRLQNVPEDYFEGVVSDSQARKMLGNGWTVDVIAHILSNIKNT